MGKEVCEEWGKESGGGERSMMMKYSSGVGGRLVLPFIIRGHSSFDLLYEIWYILKSRTKGISFDTEYGVWGNKESKMTQGILAWKTEQEEWICY